MNKLRKGKTIYLSKRKRKRKLVGQVKLFMMGALLLGAIVGIVIAFLPNAYEVKVGGKVVGTVKQKAVIDSSKEVVVKQLEEQYKSTVKLEDPIEVTKVRAKKKDIITPEYLASYMRKNMNFQVELRELLVDGKKVGIVENEQVVQELQDKLKEEYLGSKAEGKKVEFTNKVETKKVFAKEADLIKMNELVERCMTTTEKDVEYEVVSGDTMFGITDKLGITMLDLETSNPGLEPTKLKIGGKLKATVDIPLLGVKVVEEPVKLAGESKVADISKS